MKAKNDEIVLNIHHKFSYNYNVHISYYKSLSCHQMPVEYTYLSAPSPMPAIIFIVGYQVGA